MERVLRRHTASRLARGERGQAIYVVMFVMVALLAFLALSMDVGLAYAERRHMQNGADAAVAAANRIIALNTGSSTDAEVKQAIDSYAALNGGSIDYTGYPPRYLAPDGNPISQVGAGGGIPEDAVGVTLKVQTSMSTFFAAVLQRPLIDVSASASSMSYAAQMPATMQGLAPLGVPALDFQAGATYDLWSPHFGSYYGVDSQYKGVLDFSSVTGSGYVAGTDYGNKPNNAQYWSAGGYDGQIALSNTVSMYSGDLGNNVASGLRTNILNQGLSDAGGAYGIIKIAVWDDYDDGEVSVSGFAAFKLYFGNVGSSSATGLFVSYIAPGGTIDDGGGLSYGPKVVKLVPLSGILTPAPTSTLVPLPASSTTPTSVPAATSTPTVGATPVSTSTATPIPSATPTRTATPATAATATSTPCPPVVISNVSFSPVGNSGKVDVTWTTNLPSDSRIDWGTSPVYGSAVSDTNLVTSHSLQITDIDGGVTYYYAITSMGACGQVGASTGTYVR